MKRNFSLFLLILLSLYLVRHITVSHRNKPIIMTVRKGYLSDHPSITIETAASRFLVSPRWSQQGDHYGHQFICAEGPMRESGVYVTLLFEREGHSGTISLNSLELDGIKQNQTEIRMFLEEYFENKEL